MNTRMRIAFWCHLVVVILLCGIGPVYMLRPEFMPYHADAVARDWSAVEPPFQVLILALMRAVGGGWLATAVALTILLFVPFRQGLQWARWAIPAIGSVSLGTTLYSTIFVARHTKASPPWMVAAVGILLLFVGLVFSESGSRKAAQHSETRHRA